MIARAVSVLAAAASCGRLGFDAMQDAQHGGDAPVSCTFTPWNIASHVVTAATSGNDWEPALSPDGLVLVWSSEATQPPRLHVATRATTAGMFGGARGAVELWGQQPTDGAYSPMWSHDGSELYFVEVTGQGAEPKVAPYLGGGVFGARVASGLPTPGDNWAMSADELELFYTVQIAADDFDLAHATRLTAGAPWVTDALLDGLDRRGAGMREGWPSFDDARQELYLEYSVVPGTDALALARRAGQGLAFGAPAPIAEIGSDGDDPDITNGGMTLVFASDRAGGAGEDDLYVATRSCN